MSPHSLFLLSLLLSMDPLDLQRLQLGFYPGLLRQKLLLLLLFLPFSLGLSDLHRGIVGCVRQAHHVGLFSLSKFVLLVRRLLVVARLRKI